ncbi:MAG: ABC transporter substrate-binding protein [Anaerolineales bacterium]
MNRFRHLIPFFVLLVLAIAACDPSTDENGGSDDEAIDVTLFVSFIPSVQFAPVYAAIENGYFADAGLNVTVEHSFNEADGVDRIAINDLQFGLISGEQVLIARSTGRPLVYVYEWYHNFPVGVVAPADSDITAPEDLVGQDVGIPGPFGASYMGLRALLSANNLSEDDLNLNAIGFTAPETVCAGEVDAAVVYLSNEPLTIQENCFDVNVIRISDYVELISNGLVTNETTIEDHPERVAGMARGLQRGIAWTLDNPDAAFDLSVENFVQDLPEDEYETQRQVLENSLVIWQSPDPGATIRERWERTQQALLAAGLLEEPLDNLDAAYTNDFLPQNRDDD